MELYGICIMKFSRQIWEILEELSDDVIWGESIRGGVSLLSTKAMINRVLRYAWLVEIIPYIKGCGQISGSFSNILNADLLTNIISVLVLFLYLE